MRIISIIPARGGSKGIPKKNLKFLAGKPLIAHSILDAREATTIDEIYVSTDDREIAEVASQYGAKIVFRPAELASDTASSESALIHAINEIETTGILPESIVFLQCTSPIRTGKDIDRAIAQFKEENADSLLSVSPSHRFLWQKVDGIARSINYDYRQRLRRQDMQPQYIENGSIYIFKPWVIKELSNRLGGNISLFEMTEDSAWEIDSLADWETIELLIEKQNLD
jgi:CMP-N,N'-diacetyllegionaminic acid synthase